MLLVNNEDFFNAIEPEASALDNAPSAEIEDDTVDGTELMLEGGNVILAYGTQEEVRKALYTFYDDAGIPVWGVSLKIFTFDATGKSDRTAIDLVINPVKVIFVSESIRFSPRERADESIKQAQVQRAFQKSYSDFNPQGSLN